MSALPRFKMQSNSEFIAVHKAHPLRAELEANIYQGFFSAFNADIHEFMPLLSRFSNAKGQAVLGLRCAEHESLFSEAYLNSPVEHLFDGAKRHQFAELGNLFSTHRSATIGHLIVVTKALLLNDIGYLMFTGTEQVRKLMVLLQVPMREVAAADPDKVSCSADYGTYYQTNPVTCVVDLKQANQTINTVPLFASLVPELQMHIELLAKELR
ncbi:thermostable hemolysin [Pseudoalteromonas luteoviolacea B = ATCC 29581]|nr:thermostable hemolysin [Pseudoalteromonas luteoviolacea B = ATCC 29581]